MYSDAHLYFAQSLLGILSIQYLKTLEEQSNDIKRLLVQLHETSGAEYSRLVETIARRGEFHPLESEMGIFTTGGELHEDYANLLSAARKAVEHGYQVFILPNPKGIRSADFIFERKGIFRLYDLKTIIGKASVMNRLLESVGQSNRVLLNMVTEYNGTSLGRCINKYFERNPYAVEVLLFKRNKVISITRRTVAAKNFISTFCRLYYK